MSEKKDLTISQIERQNILNNTYAMKEVEKAVGITGIPFEGKFVILKEQVANFFDVTVRTIETYIEKYAEELSKNGYEVVKGNRLKILKNSIGGTNVPEIDFGNINRAPQLSVFDFRAFLNIAMVISDSKNAVLLRNTILDIVIDTINQRTGGGTKYINQRDEDFITSWFEEENYRKKFTSALTNYMSAGKFKYPNFTNKIYVSIFKENAEEYRKILKLEAKDKTRDTFYSEVLDLVASYECGFADMLEKKCAQIGRPLNNWEANTLFSEFEKQAHWKPLIEKARSKMASRDLAFRDALHLQLKDYLRPLNHEEFEKFIGEKSKELSLRLEEASDVMKRLKNRE